MTSISSIFKRDIEYIHSILALGREPVLDEYETYAVNNYAMKRAKRFTPLLR